jgi:hypothetical protein
METSQYQLDTQIMNRGNRLNGGVEDANWICRNLVLSSAGRALENLILGQVQLQSVDPHPDIFSTLGKAVSKGRNIRRSTGAVHLSVISLSMGRKQMMPNERK